jgi:hypothetical protein
MEEIFGGRAKRGEIAQMISWKYYGRDKLKIGRKKVHRSIM